MKTKVKVLFFGMITGMIWSVIPYGTDMFNSGGDSALILFAGALTGLLVSLALKDIVTRSGPVGTVIAGLISLPLGAFIYGFISSILYSSFHDGFTGILYGFFIGFLAGAYFALLASVSRFGVILFLLAVLSTFTFRAVIRSGQESGTAI